MTQSTNDSLLRRALRANGIFCTFSGLFLLIAGAPVADFLAVESALVIRLIGVALLPYGFNLIRETGITPLHRYTGPLAIAGDIAWVIGSIAIIIADPFDLSAAGKWAILAVADIVATFAVIQIIGLRRMR